MVHMRTLQECQILPVDGFANTSYSSLGGVVSVTNAYFEPPFKTCIFPILDIMIVHN
jgi:hypothetical protein